MSSGEFERRRDELARGRAEHAAAIEDLARARERVKQLDAAVARARRDVGGDREIERERARAQEDVRRAEEVVGGRRQDAGDLLNRFETFTDPRKNVTRLPDDYPILLFPLRLETRFKTIDSRRGLRHELWVRIFPDTCVIDTFEPILSESEVRVGQAYWREVWRAAGVEDGRRAAWRNLVASVGSGRAQWVLREYVPANMAAEPFKASPDDVVLVIGTDSPLPAAEAAAADTYWAAVWRADGDPAAEDAARADLRTAAGDAGVATIEKAYRPYNLADVPVLPLEKADVQVMVATVEFPTGIETTRVSWTRPATVSVLPERFVLVGRSGEETVEAIGAPIASPLHVGPDPSVPEGDGMHPEERDFKFPEELAWLADFDAALAAGMAMKVELTSAQAARGFEQLFVAGVRVSADAKAGRDLLEALLEHHHFGRSGLALVPQGAPTNNTETNAAAFTTVDDADGVFDDLEQGDLFTPTPDPLEKRDGQWLAEALGVHDAALQRVHGSDGTDQLEARAMQLALWPATLGYFMDAMMAPVFDDEDVGATRAYFSRYVTGRGSVPAIRIGRQPYGVLPTTAFSRMRWLEGRREGFLRRLYGLLRTAWSEWAMFAPSVAHVGPTPDPQQTLLDILGLHASSVEFHSRYARSLRHLYNHLNLVGAGAGFRAELQDRDLAEPGAELLEALGYEGTERPAILGLFFHGGQAILDGPLVDDRPLSETQAIREWTTDHRNYLQWLLDAAATSLDALRLEDGFIDDRPPTALLYLLLRHALMQGYHATSYELHRANDVLEGAQLAELKREPTVVHVDTRASAQSESRWGALYKAEPAITGAQDVLVADYITELVQTNGAGAGSLREQLDALELLKDVATARLERVFAEHLDCCGYRLDAWLLGLVSLQLEQMHSSQDEGEEGRRNGVYLGAYGWLENLRPKTAPLEPVTLPADVAPEFEEEGAPPFVHDPTNGGYVLAPSLDHALTAAVLRSGYLANASAGNPTSLAVNLSSRRVRLALSLLDGIRSGQGLGALLGYRFERGLHDAHATVELDRFVLALRKAFPLRADKLSPTKTDDDVPIELVEARNVLDGLALVEHLRTTGNTAYPFGLMLPDASATEAAAIAAQANALVDIYDALADVALAEGVHQAVRGNFDRASGTLAAYTTGQFPPEPDVVRTPTSGIAITHRVGLHLDPAAAAPAGATPRAVAEPSVNAWLATVLPDLDQIRCKATWRDPVDGTAGETIVRMDQLGLQPIDLLYLVQTDSQQAMTELDDRIVRRVLAAEALRPDAETSIQYMERLTGFVTIFELAPLIRALRSLVLRSRPLQPGDIALHNEAKSTDDTDVSVDRSRIADVQTLLDQLHTDMTTYLGGIQPLLDDLPNRADDIVSGIDAFLEDAVSLLSRAARLSVAHAGFGFILAWRQATFKEVLRRVQALVDRWGRTLDAFDDQLDAYDLAPPPSEEERFTALQRIEREIRTTAQPLPATSAALRGALNTDRGVFDAKRTAFVGILGAGGNSTATLLQDVEAELPIADFDLEPLDIADIRAGTVTFAGELAAAVRAVATELDSRSKATDDQLALHDGTTAPVAKVAALDAAAKALLGDDFHIVPTFGIPSERRAELQQAFDSSDDLLSYVEDDLSISEPVDEWLGGVATVREKVRAWQQVMLQSGMLVGDEPELTPLQLPAQPDDSWLALDFPPDYALAGDRLLYTAHHATPFAANARQAGLLLDEWTEVLPSRTHTTGVSFNFDRPSSEPPQNLLLVTPASWGSGEWRWEDIVDALQETLTLAKLRAVEPVHLDATPYARFLPAVVMAAMLRDISIATVLAVNDRVYDRITARG